MTGDDVSLIKAINDIADQLTTIGMILTVLVLILTGKLYTSGQYKDMQQQRDYFKEETEKVRKELQENMSVLATELDSLHRVRDVLQAVITERNTNA